MVKRLRGGKLTLGNSKRRQREIVSEIKKLTEGLSIRYVDPRSLKPNPKNARVRTDRHITQIAASIREFGNLNPILTDEASNVVAGHGRLAAALKLGLAQIPVVSISHLSAEQKRAYAIADNRLAELSEWDPNVLRIELEELSTLELSFDFEVTGFDTVDLDHLTALGVRDQDRDHQDDPADTLPLLGRKALSKHGDLWRLGSHLLLCGDARERASYSRLLGNTRAEMVITDPPYNVPIQGHVTSRSRHREFPMASGEMSERQFFEFLRDSFQRLYEVSCDGAIHYICMDWRHAAVLTAAASEVYNEYKQLCVWTKEQAGMGSFYRSQHELVFVFKVGTAPHINNFGLGERGRYRTNVWRYASPKPNSDAEDNVSAEHPTVKPVAMFVDAIKDCSRRNGIVLDPFGGSGTTLIAAERTRRCARLIELDPLYVDLAIRRWQVHAGSEAIHEVSGRSFEDIEHSLET